MKWCEKKVMYGKSKTLSNILAHAFGPAGVAQQKTETIGSGKQLKRVGSKFLEMLLSTRKVRWQYIHGAYEGSPRAPKV